MAVFSSSYAATLGEQNNSVGIGASQAKNNLNTTINNELNTISKKESSTSSASESSKKKSTAQQKSATAQKPKIEVLVKQKKGNDLAASKHQKKELWQYLGN
jgi:predicted lipase